MRDVGVPPLTEPDPPRPADRLRLTDPGLAGAEVVGRVCDDQRARWQAGDRIPAEAYLSLHPALAGDLDNRLEVVYGEVALREERGERPTADEYAARFPELAGRLALLFRMQGAIRDTAKDGATLADTFAGPAGAEGEAPAEVVGGYRVVGVIGRGGMGVVWKAIQPGTGRVVALKMMSGGPAPSPAAERRFRTEVEALARLAHPNVVPVFDAGVHEGRPFLVMEYVPGRSLADRIAEGPLDADAASALVETLARAVQAMHDRGVVHRDLKPSNILFTADGVPKVADFGLARLNDRAVAETATGEIVGSPQYMAPEQADARRGPVGAAADVYALGAIYFELLTGRPPFQAATVMELIRQVVSCEPVAPTRLIPGLRRDAETIALTCLRKEPARRFADAKALADDLRRLLDRVPIRARPVGPAGRAVAWARRNPALAATAGSTAALLVLVAAGSVASARHFRGQSGALSAALRQAVDLRDGIEAERDRYRRRLYVAEMNLAGQAWDAPGGAVHVAEIVGRWEGRGGPADPRGWEWDYLWGAAHGEAAVLPGLSLAAWSPDGTRVVGRVGDALEVRGRDGRTRLRLAADAPSPLSAPSWSRDGRRIAAAGHSGAATIWDAETGQRIWSVRAHDGPAFAFAWCPADGRVATAGGRPGSTCLKVWRPPSAEPIATFPMSPTTALERPGMLSWSPDGARLAVAQPSGGVTVHDPDTGAITLSIPAGQSQSLAVAFSPDGTRLALCDEGKSAQVRDARDGRLVARLDGHADRVECLAWSSDGARIATGGWDAAVIVWSADGGPPLDLIRGHGGPVFRVAWSPTGDALLSSTEHDEARIWDADPAGRDRLLRGHAAFVSCLAWSRDGRLLASGAWDGTVRVWDPATGLPRRVLASGCRIVRGVAFRGDGRTLAVGGGNDPDDSGVEVWDAVDGVRLRRFRASRWPDSLAWAPGGPRLIASWDGVGAWDADTGTRTFLYVAGQDYPCVALSPDGRRLALPGRGEVRIVDEVSGAPIRTLRHEANRQGLDLLAAWCPDGRRLAAVGSEGTAFVVRILDADDGAAPTTLRGHTGPIRAIAWSPDGARVASGGRDGFVKVWDAVNGAELVSLRVPAEETWAIAWSPDGARLAVAGTGGVVRVLDASRGRGRRLGR